MPDDAAGRGVFSEISRFPRLLHTATVTFSPRFNLIGSQHLYVTITFCYPAIFKIALPWASHTGLLLAALMPTNFVDIKDSAYLLPPHAIAATRKALDWRVGFLIVLRSDSFIRAAVHVRKGPWSGHAVPDFGLDNDRAVLKHHSLGNKSLKIVMGKAKGVQMARRTRTGRELPLRTSGPRSWGGGGDPSLPSPPPGWERRRLTAATRLTSQHLFLPPVVLEDAQDYSGTKTSAQCSNYIHFWTMTYDPINISAGWILGNAKLAKTPGSEESLKRKASDIMLMPGMRGMVYESRPLVFVRGSMNTDAYCNILDNEMLPTLWRFYGMDPCYFQDDNARCHVSRTTMQWYADNNVRRLDWPVQSPDLNPIEHLWDELDRQVRARQALRKSIAQLMEWLQEDWRRIFGDVLQTLIESMPDSVAAVIASRENGATVAEQLACLPPTKAIRVQSESGASEVLALSRTAYKRFNVCRIYENVGCCCMLLHARVMREVGGDSQRQAAVGRYDKARRNSLAPAVVRGFYNIGSRLGYNKSFLAKTVEIKDRALKPRRVSEPRVLRVRIVRHILNNSFPNFIELPQLRYTQLFLAGNCPGETYTQRDENTARQLRVLRLGAMWDLMRVAVSPLTLPRLSASNAEESSRASSEVRDSEHRHSEVALTGGTSGLDTARSLETVQIAQGRWIGEVIGRGLSLGPIPAFAWSDFGKQWKTDIRMAGPGIEPGYLPNASPVSYHCTTSLSAHSPRSTLELALTENRSKPPDSFQCRDMDL
ncbi:hypothetical protein PR048_000332 [Dryococelus australis]|uniref:Tc1-like transposase DDE domain-containing protein n=1 Tax=Dryococelus australis TaxID=614101 RepID=A0ABQ9IEC0_9NEOP|nr:hypothetical protein PR048_000332 [Dryococelus australis]